MRDNKDYCWNNHIYDDDNDNDMINQRYPVVREKKPRDYVKTPSTPSPLKLKSYSNNIINYKSSNNVDTNTHTEIGPSTKQPKKKLDYIPVERKIVISTPIDKAIKTTPIGNQQDSSQPRKKIEGISQKQQKQIDDNFQPFIGLLKINPNESSKILVLKNKLAEAEFKIKKLMNFQKEKQILNAQKATFQKLFEEALAANKKIQQQMAQILKQKQNKEEQYISLLQKYQILEQNYAKVQTINKALQEYKGKNEQNAKQIQKLKESLTKSTHQNELLTSIKLINQINIQKFKKLGQQKSQSINKLQQQVKQKKKNEQKFKKQAQAAKVKVISLQTQIQYYKKKLKQFQQQINSLKEDKKIMQRRQQQNIGFCKYCLQRKAKFVNVQCGHVNVCEVCVKHQICFQACMTCKAKGQYKQIFCSLLRNQ